MEPTQFGYWFPPNIGNPGVADKVDFLIDTMHWAMLVLFVGWGIFFVYCLVKFRQRPGHQADYHLVKAKPSKYAEVAVIVFEAIVLLGFSMPVWAKVKAGIPSGPEVVNARVVAEQFAWNFHYPGPDGRYGRVDPLLMTAANPLGLDENDPDAKDDVTTLNALHIPVGKDVVLQGTSKDVIHSFALPVMRAKQDVIPGMRVPIWFKATQTSDQLRERLTTTYALEDESFKRKMIELLPAEDIKGKDGSVIIARAGTFTDDIVANLKAAGVNEVRVGPRNPVEVACAQLCGNSHYKMKGYVVVHTQEEFDKWMAEQVAAKQDAGEWDEWGG